MSEQTGLSLDLVCACGAISALSARFCAECGRQLAAPPTSAPDSDGAPAPASGARSADWPGALDERRRVTALFADISGFTALASRLGTEELLEILDPTLEAMARIVARYDGYLEKFAGDALLALFGAPVAHEDDAARALRAAEDMHAELRAVGTRAPEYGLSLHVGITTGEVVARSLESDGRAQYAVLGESVILAQRLESLAPPGETYVGSMTASLVERDYLFEDLGPMSVKGRTEPVEVRRLLGRRTTPAPRERHRVIGREAQQGLLTEALEAARSGSGSAVALTGPAGIGKSRLLDEVRARATAEGMLCVDIVGASYSRSAYRSLAPLFEAALAARYPHEPTSRARLRRLESDPEAPAGVAVTSLLLGEPADGQSLGDRVPEGVRRDLHLAAAAWLLDLSAGRPVVILVDNLQWVERSSAELLDELATAVCAGRPVLLCASGRPPFRPAAGVRVVDLGPLSEDEVRELIVDELELAPDDRLVALVVDRSSGNPLMVRETVRQLRAERLLDVRDGHAHMIAGAHSQQIPVTVESLLNARIDAVPAQAVSVAVSAAAIGYVVPRELLRLVVGVDADRLEDHVSELVAAEILSEAPDDALAFDSTLLRDVLYARLTGRRRRALHARIADVLEDPDVAATTPSLLVALLAEHRYLAGDYAAALRWLRVSAERSRQVFAHDDAVVALTRAVEAARETAPEEVAPLLCDLADVRTELGEYARAGELYQEASELGRSSRSVAGEAASLRRQGSYADAEKLLRLALRHPLPMSGDERLVWRELSWVLSVSGDLEGSLAAADHGMTLSPTPDGVTGQLQCQMVRAETLLGRYEAAYDHLTQAIENLEQAQDLAGLCTALRLEGALHERMGALDEAASTLQRGLELAERTGLAEEVGGCLINLGLVHGARSDHRAASECYARAAITFEQTGNRAGRAMAYGNRAYELLALGDTGPAQELARRGLQLADEVGNHMTAADIHHTLGLVHESLGDLEGALAEAGRAIDEFDLAGMPEAAGESRELARRVSGTTPGR